ncbi:hypothetical protein M409DRAFT_55304 [Zasmidium cellare ATCC 36951]|uniref:BZIP domain-containing protein n=1 Tax=Zasmidium cellare ATCC 36951 TaxID=1080233 RepID=A0A6A6CFV4_ZASCE|nr:uncharacterized protein M409DRAFT_55304 [Zasmidium cellare ATCC 36951]KAF2165941.1 hypothetical protein M409DRAFT_55304 [Zasmidium cellare ATCC 36951]
MATTGENIDEHGFMSIQQTLESPVDRSADVSHNHCLDGASGTIAVNDQSCEQDALTFDLHPPFARPILPRRDHRKDVASDWESIPPHDLYRDSDSIMAGMRTCAKLKRQAQNRAAQRAYRERKLKQVAELETQVKALENNLECLRAENKRLKQQLHKTRDHEDRINHSPDNGIASRYETRRPSGHTIRRTSESTCEGPISCTKRTTAEAPMADVNSHDTSASAMWALIQSYLRRQQDDFIEAVWKRLKDMECHQCHEVLALQHEDMIEVFKDSGSCVGVGVVQPGDYSKGLV